MSQIEYHKRLRHGADQRSFELEQQLTISQATSSNYLSGYDDAHKGLVEESHVLLSKNSVLVYQLSTVRTSLQGSG